MKAFPILVENPDKSFSCNQGMDLRDYFASMATEQDVKNYERHIGKEISVTDTFGRERKQVETIYYTREQAKYRYADAMMQARKTIMGD